MPPPYRRTEMELRVCDLVIGGKTLQWLETQPGFPSRRTLSRWARENPAFAAGLRNAQTWARGQRGVAAAGWCFNEAQAERLLAELRRGESVEGLLSRPEFPNRKRLNRWKQERPDFAEAFAAAAQISRRLRGTRWRAFDRAAADRIICRVNAGERMRSVLADPDLPGPWVVKGWRRRRPDFDYALRMALTGGHRRRMAARRGPAPELADTICDRIAAGATLEALSEAKDMPGRRTVQRWMRRDAGFKDRVRMAAAARDEPLADEALAVAEAATPETLEAARLRIAELRRTLGRRGFKRRPEGGG